LVLFKNFDLFRSTDLLSGLVVLYSIVMASVIGRIDENWKLWFYVGQAITWRIFHTYILGGVLYLQSKDNALSKHFIRFGEGPREAFFHWKWYSFLHFCLIYHLFLLIFHQICIRIHLFFPFLTF